MRVLILGNGGREHAMARALRSAREVELYCAPSNPGLDALATALLVDPCDANAVAQAAVKERIELVVPGPEAPLVHGVADALAEVGISCCGPSRAAAELEASKAFTRTLTAPLGVPGPRFVIVRRQQELQQALRSFSSLPVVKADGLAAGKGVYLPASWDECTATAERLLSGELGAAGATVLLEERLLGQEASLFYACHGRQAVPLPHARDYKRLGDGDRGPNTGGMGAISPSPDITPELQAAVRDKIVVPTLDALYLRGTPFCGFLFVGLMLTPKGPALLEFNVRLGDPEAQVLLPHLADGEFARLAYATATGGLSGFTLRTTAGYSCAVVLCAHGYPEAPRLGDEISLDEALARSHAATAADVWLNFAGTRRAGDKLVTAGGRVLSIVARGDAAEQARARAYAAVAGVRFSGMQWRGDIGATKVRLP
jgi:phosphoribosylamine--glycine ligase